MKFTKMQALGNDYVYVNCFDESVGDPAALAREISDRHRGVGSDGLILICPSDKADVRMEVYNADGSRAEMCGNGIRCVAKFAYEHGLIKRTGKVLGPMGKARALPTRSPEQLDQAMQDQEGRKQLVAKQVRPGVIRLSRRVGGRKSVSVALIKTPERGARRRGARAVTKSLAQCVSLQTKDILIETDTGVRVAGLLIGNEHVELVCVDMGEPSLAASDLGVSKDPEVLAAAGLTAVPDKIVDSAMRFDGDRYRVTCVSMGNPHAVIFVDDLARIDLARQGRAIETAPVFSERINANFARVNSSDDVTVLTWERGSGATQACGSGASAACVAGAVTGRTARHITAHLPGGDCWLQWAEDDHVYLTGPAEEAFTGEWLTQGESNGLSR